MASYFEKLILVIFIHLTLLQDYLDGLLNTDNPEFEQMVSQIYPAELQLNKANTFDTEPLPSFA